MREFSIRENEAGQRLDKYLGKLLQNAPKSFCYKMLRKKNITLNDKKASGSEKLDIGDVVRLYLSDETFRHFYGDDKEACPGAKPEKKMPSPEILYEDGDILLVNKPAGILSVPAKAGELSMLDVVTDYLLRSGAVRPEELHTFHPAICNRLDQNTSGILAAGKTLAGLQALSHAFREHRTDKRYLCLAAGELTKEIHDQGYLDKDERQNKVTLYRDFAEGRSYIEAYFRPLCQGKGCTLMEAKLITGKPHQIRAALAGLGHPILGDTKYGNAKLNTLYRNKYALNRQLLHAYSLCFTDPEGILCRTGGRTFLARPGHRFESILDREIPGWRETVHLAV
ncbi:MAG: RluA family pseudouridine synthase [Blautia sp.]|nr:RluA family pseudouridine synthase [Blautia sp.]